MYVYRMARTYTEAFNIRLTHEHAQLIDALRRAEQGEIPSRPEMIRRLIERTAAKLKAAA